jgi:serine/threonine-protein kinase
MASAETAADEAIRQAHSASLVGQILDGRYRILRKLGGGWTGEVYAAEFLLVGQPVAMVAVKVLYRETASSPIAVTRYFEQARSASSIGHRNITGIVAFGQLADGRAYLCMDLLSGAALRDLIAQPMAVDRLLSTLMQAGQGLAAAHARGIIHRDLKPENIFVTIGPAGEDVPKLLDFGIADASSTDDQPRTRAGIIFGTPFYWAPEQARGKPVDARTDIYALGLIMYESFSGTLPFQDESPLAILNQHVTMEPEPIAQRAARAGRSLPPGLAEIITRCLQKDPAQRFQTMDELVAALSQIHRDVTGPGGDLPITASRALPGSIATEVPTLGSRALPGSAAMEGLPTPGSRALSDSRESLGSQTPGSRALSDSRESTAPPAAPPLALDENVQFTVYRPRAIAPLHWYSLLAFAHLAERRPGELDAPDPIEEVRREAEAVLGEHAAAYQSTTQDSGAAIPAEGELVLVVDIPGVEVNPPRRSFLWTEPVHREEFRIRAGAQSVGTTARGRLTVFLGCIVIAELPLALRVDATPATTAVEHTQVRTYRRIFASYSHRDRAIVNQFERYARALGDEYLRDSIQLRSGEVWSYQLLRLIEQADAFQLFWSHNSMHSIYVRREYEYALSLDRPSFVRPTYWEEPMPKAEGLPPEALRRLHFQKLGDPKRGGSRDISELKQRLGLKKATPPLAGAAAGRPNRPAGGVGRPPRHSCPAPPQPVIPNTAEDPFAAMNAMAGVGTSSRTGSVPNPPMMLPPDVLSSPREHTGAHEILARDQAESRAAEPRKCPPTLELLIERDGPAPSLGAGYGQQPGMQQSPYGQQAGMPQPANPYHPQRPPSHWPTARRVSLLALAVLALVMLILCVLLRWMF